MTADVVTYAREWCQQGTLPLPDGMTDAQALEIVDNLFPGNLRAFTARMVPCQGAGCHAEPGEACLTRCNGAGGLHVVRERDSRELLAAAWRVIFAADGIVVSAGWTVG
jgi:hypothetical protein